MAGDHKLLGQLTSRFQHFVYYARNAFIGKFYTDIEEQKKYDTDVFPLDRDLLIFHAYGEIQRFIICQTSRQFDD